MNRFRNLIEGKTVAICNVFAHLLRTECKMEIAHKVYNIHAGDSISKIDLIQDEFVPIHLASATNSVDLSRQMNYACPLPGILLIYEILRRSYKSLYHTGFPCFQDHTRISAHVEVTLIRKHHALRDLRYLRQITTRNEFISTDEYMLKLFEWEKNLE